MCVCVCVDVHTQRDREGETEMEKEHTSGLRFFILSLPFPYSLSNHCPCQKAPWTICCPVPIQIWLGATFELKYPKMPFEFKD